MALMRRWLVLVLGTLAIAALGCLGWVYDASERHLRSFPQPAPFALPIPTDAAAIARGDHLVRTRGCRGCHGAELEGELMWEFAVSPNLARYAREESPATFEAAFRHGIGRDGRALYSMPSYNFMRMRDNDVADVIAYLRSVPVVDKALPSASLPWSIRWAIARGEDAAIAAHLHKLPPLVRGDDPDPRIARGEYLAMTTCNECHGFGLRADSPFEGETAPDLLIIGAYDEPAFRRLMGTGIALGERELPMMSGVARGRFAHFTDTEVGELYVFLRDLRERRADAIPLRLDYPRPVTAPRCTTTSRCPCCRTKHPRH